MAYNTKAILTDVNGKPIPQFYNPTTDKFEPLQGSGGAARHVLYGSDGNPISTDFATQTTLTAILDKIIAAPATEAKQTALNTLIGEVQATPTANTLLARLKNLETKVDAIIADGIKLSGSKVIPISLLSTNVSIGAGTVLDLDTLVDLSNIGNNGHGVSVFIGDGANDNQLPIEVYVKYYLGTSTKGLRDRSNNYTTVYTGTGAAHFFSFVPVYPKFKLSIKNTHASVSYNINNVIVQSGL